MALERLRECHFLGFSPFCLQSGARWWDGKETVYFFILCAHIQYTFIFISQFTKPKS